MALYHIKYHCRYHRRQSRLLSLIPGVGNGTGLLYGNSGYPGLPENERFGEVVEDDNRVTI